MADKCVMLFTDNAAVVDIINKQTSKHHSIMVLIRDLELSRRRKTHGEAPIKVIQIMELRTQQAVRNGNAFDK